MRLAGIEKGGFYPYPIPMAEAVSAASLPGPSRRQMAHAEEFWIRVLAKTEPISGFR